jgi:hypothetical protein
MKNSPAQELNVTTNASKASAYSARPTGQLILTRTESHFIPFHFAAFHCIALHWISLIWTGLDCNGLNFSEFDNEYRESHSKSPQLKTS